MVAIPVQKVANGMKIEFKNDVWNIVEAAHHKPGKGGAVVRLRIKSLTTERTLEETFNASEKVEQTEVRYARMAFLYKQDEDYIFMDNDNYEQYTIPEDIIGDQARFLAESLEINVTFWNEKIIGVELPAKVDLKVIDTFSAERGNTATNITKDATLASGYVAQVPLFVNTGDVVRIDTRDGSYETRVN